MKASRMKICVLTVFVIALFLSLNSSVHADGILLSWSMRAVPRLIEKSFNELKHLTGEKIAKELRRAILD